MKTDTDNLFPLLRATVQAHRSLWANTVKFSKLTLSGKLVTLPMNIITEEFAFGLMPEGWNYSSSLLAEVGQQRDRTPEQTNYYRFFQAARINKLHYLDDILYLHEPSHRPDPDHFRFHLGTYPWGGWTQEQGRTGGEPFGWFYDQQTGSKTRDLWGYKRNWWYRPNCRESLDLELHYLIRTLEMIQSGYCPLFHGSFPSVCLMIRRDGEKRAVMVDGHHRLTALCHLGHTEAMVEIIHTVEEANVDEWFYVRTGQCSKERALEIFDAFFTLNGRERFAALNL